jgi:hypothetical protein
MGRNGLTLQLLAPTRWDQQKEMVSDCPQIHGQIKDLGELMEVALGNCRVDLKL